MTDISKLSQEAKDDFEKWCKVTIKQKRESLGQASSQVEVIKDKVRKTYDEIIYRQGQIMKDKSNIAWHMGWVATLEKQIADIESVFGKIYPDKTQQIRLDVQEDLVDK